MSVSIHNLVEPNIQPKSDKTVAQDWPKFIALEKIKTPKAVLHASTPA